ncbi:NADH:flavin oxidoreductase/NADH oxidase family protein [Pseudomonas nicosulfuronedens]
MTAFAEVLNQPLHLPCGAVLKNRIAKAALSETLGTLDQSPTQKLARLYQRWSAGGSGLLITGNVMVDRLHLGEPGNVAIDDERDITLLQRWASAGTQAGNHLWMQLNHPGKQTPLTLSSGDTLAPSAVPFSPDLQSFFKTPRALTEPEILDIIRRFATAAKLAKFAGFTGVQVHGAHGYLVSQFLSGHHNQRTDQWGGSLENRMRFPLEIFRAIRQEVGPEYPISLKLNSADFQRGGFSEEESMVVAQVLSAEGLDLLEISGGNYENPAMAQGIKDSTRQREAYFLDYAERIRKRVSVLLMVTGGFRSAEAMGSAVSIGATDLIGVGRPLAVEPDLPNRILRGKPVRSVVEPRRTGIKAIDRLAMMEFIWFTRQIHRMGAGKDPIPNESVIMAMIRSMTMALIDARRIRRLRA